MRTLTIQPQIKNVMEKLPYPFIVNLDTGEVLHQELWNGKPKHFIGFTLKGKQEIKMDWTQVSTMTDALLNTIPGSYDPVFSYNDGSFYSCRLPNGYTLKIQEV